MNRDPIGEMGGVHLFAMVKNRPVIAIDYLGAAEVSCKGADDVGNIQLLGVKLVTTLVTENSVTFQGPKGYLKSFVGDIVKDEISKKAAEKSKLYKQFQAMSKSTKKMVGYLGLVVELYSSAGFYLDEIKVTARFKCCKCTKSSWGVYYIWSDPKEADAEESSIYLNFKRLDDVKQMPDKYIDVMLNAARDMRSKCRSKCPQ